MRIAKKTRWAVVAIAALALAQMAGPAVQAGPPSCTKRNNDTIQKLLECVTVAGIRQHQAAFQSFADATDGTRLAGTEGYDLSADYVAGKLRAAGYEVTIQEFDFPGWRPLGASALEQTAPTPTTYVEDVDFTLMTQSDPGDVTAAVTAVDINLTPPRANTSGCEGAYVIGPDGSIIPNPNPSNTDFATFPAGNIALIQRGTCTFEIKALNAAAAGAVGVIMFNQGNTPAREGLFGATLGATNESGIPAIATTFARGAEWAGTAGLVMRIFNNVFREIVTTTNVLAESRFGDDNNVVMAGAHLDSVPQGPGINDNGSGSAALLEIALHLRKLEPVNTLRFAWWGAEESGLVGSRFYTSNLTPAEVEDIALYLNFDMIGSPNFARLVYDGDSSDTPGANPPGSGDIEQLFLDYFGSKSLPTQPTEIGNRSDHAGFRDLGIPIGGLFSGAEAPKTAEQVTLFGGLLGEQLDPCYHEACDTFAGTGGATAPGRGLIILDQFSDAAAFAILTYAYDTSSVG